jgi:parvulin-like peptidyl-prolyl isomerase
MNTPINDLSRPSGRRPGIGTAAALLLFVGLGWAVLSTSCSQAPGPVPLAIVGDRQITVEDFQREVARRIAARRVLPDKETLLQEMVNQEALVQRARQMGLLDDPQVQREINVLLIGKLREREIDPRVERLQITDEEVAAEYERNIDRYTQPAKVRLAMLFLEANPKMSEAKRNEIQERLSEAHRRILESPARGGRGAAAGGFGALAIDYSDDQASRYRGGDMGWLNEGSFDYHWPHPVLEAGYRLTKNEVSEIIQTEGGFYLVMKTDSRPSSTKSLAEVEAVLKHSLLASHRRELNESFQQESIDMAPVTINPSALADVELPSPGSLAGGPSHESGPPGFPFGAESHGN